jgi:NAD(P)-dependent dehydrogenase (short-subunit alcohol dehydrogenase family)
MSDGKPVALVTGAAGGIGSATAVEFARRGYDLALTDLQSTDAVCDAARKLGTRTFAASGDLVDLAFGEQFVNDAAREFGRIDVLVNNAAWRDLSTMREITPEAWDKTIRICLTAPAFLAQWTAAHMERRRRGVIINISSIMANLSWGLGPAYVAAKGGLDALTRDLAALYGPAGIRVLSISPGAIDTTLVAAEPDSPAAQRVRKWSEEMIPLGRWGQPAEIARAAAMLAGDDASYITGASIVVDGGWSHQMYPYDIKRALRPDQFP